MGCHLFQKNGRGVELTAEGRTALSYAEQIFTLGAELEAAVGNKRGGGRTCTSASASRMRCPRRWPIACWSRRSRWPSRCA